MAIGPNGQPFVPGAGLIPRASNAVNDNINRTRQYLSRRDFRGSEPRTENVSQNFSVYGYQPDGDPVPREYVVRIKSFKNRSIVRGILQNRVQQRVESRWDPAIPTAFSSIEDLTQLFTGGRVSLQSRVTTRRKWRGTTPMEITFSLHFEAINDPSTEVVLPCRELMSIALPSEETGQGLPGLAGDVLNALPLSSPPGPSPYEWWNILNSKYRDRGDQAAKKELFGGRVRGDIIEVQIGKFQSFNNVIMKVPTIEFHNRYGADGLPMAADAQVRFETYEMLTKEELKRVFEAPDTERFFEPPSGG